ncbi:ATP-binding cassette transporter CGR1 [Agyrium rufum]|nr:ATP-binding cassette transporter CGR1 [Agyrium rufum]
MEEKGHRKSAIVVGAGVGGVATAARLAKAGFDVSVYEKNDFTGGRCSLIHHEGYRFDQGPSLLLLPDLFREAFTDLDTSLEAEGVELLKCEPNYNLWFADGESFELSSDTARMKRSIEKWEGKHGFERYLAFLQESHRHYEISVREVLRKNFFSLFSLLRPSFLRHVLALHPFESVYSRASKYFYTERLRRAFTFGSMYMGMSPFDAPGTYSLLQYTELAEGIWYPRGGFHRVIQALQAVGERMGVKYHLSTSVARVNITHGRATGITLANGTSYEADVVIVNADLVYAYNNLLPHSSTATSLSKRDSSCSSISFYWALNRQIPELTTHNIFLADAYRESFDDIFKKQLIPSEPSFYVNVPSRIDPSAAPPGCDSIVVLVPVGHLLDPNIDESSSSSTNTGLDISNPQDWARMVSTARRTIIDTVTQRTGCIDLSKAIIHEEINTPTTWKDKFNLDKGAILGLSHSFFNVLSFRPKTKHARYANLFFVGASTHPGTGVPICLAGAKITAEQILGEKGVAVPWRAGNGVRMRQESLGMVSGLAGKGGEVREIDRVQTGPLLSNVHWGFVMLVLGGLMVLYFIGFTEWERVGEEVWTAL